MSPATRYRLPPEWGPHDAVWLQWPEEAMRDYPGYAVKLESAWLEMVRLLHPRVTVRVVAGSEPLRDRLERTFRAFGFATSAIEVLVQPLDDVWARDNGPIFVQDGEGRLAVSSWRFNGWGGRCPSGRDARLPAAVATRLGLPLVQGAITLEGGALEVDGRGTLMATRSSILNPNRNPGLDQAGAEAALRQVLGVERFLWLSGAPADVCERLGDLTDWHVDLAARFTPGGAILHAEVADPSDPRHPYLVRHLAELRAATDAGGRPWPLVPLPVPRVHSVGVTSLGAFPTAQARQAPGHFTDASYANYLVTNGLVLVPVFGHAEDQRALAVIAEHFPGREVVGIPALSLTEEGGAIHCVTQQQPAARSA